MSLVIEWARRKVGDRVGASFSGIVDISDVAAEEAVARRGEEGFDARILVRPGRRPRP